MTNEIQMSLEKFT